MTDLAYTLPDRDHHDIITRDRSFIQLLSKVEGFLFMLVIIIFSNAFIATFLFDPESTTNSSPIKTLILMLGYIFVGIMTLKRMPQILRLVVFNPLLILCVLWCALSVGWSAKPDLSIKLSFYLLMTTLFGLVLAARYDWCEMLQKLAIVFSFLAFSAMILGVFFPSISIHTEIHPGAWFAPWENKNYMGGNMTKGVIICMCALAMRPDRWYLWIPGGLMCMAMVLTSTSKTSLLTTLSMSALFMAIFIYRKWPGFRVPLIYTIVFSVTIFSTLMIVIPEEMFELIGKDPTFSGRTDIWNGLISSIKERPFLGYGYGIYWTDPLGPSYFVRLHLEWGSPSAHHGWIETWLSAGFVAVFLFGVLFLWTLILAFIRVKKGGIEAYWAVLSTLMFFMFSMSESTILQANDISWVMFVATSAKLLAFEQPYWYKKKPKRHRPQPRRTYAG